MHRIPRFARFAALAASLVVAFAGIASAKELEITPFVGALMPTSTMLLANDGSALLRNTTHTVFGVALGVPMSDRFDLEFAGAAGTGKFEIVGGSALELASTTWMADVRARFRLAGGEDAQLGLIAGVGWSQFKNGLFDSAHELDDDVKYEGKVTGIVGLGVKAHVTDRLSVVFDVADRIHDQGADAPTLLPDFSEKTQHDVTATAGLSFPLH